MWKDQVDNFTILCYLSVQPPSFDTFCKEHLSYTTFEFSDACGALKGTKSERKQSFFPVFFHSIEFLNIIVRICILLPLSYMLHSISPNNTSAYELQTPACSPWPEFLLSNTAHRDLQHGPRSHLIIFMAPPSPGCWCLVLIHFCLFEFLTHCLILTSGHFVNHNPSSCGCLDSCFLLPLPSERSTSPPWFLQHGIKQLAWPVGLFFSLVHQF